MTLLDQISDALGASGTLGDLASTLGASSSDTESLVNAGLPAVLGGLGAQAQGEGVGALMGLLGDSGGFVDNIGAFFSQGDKTGLASKLISSILGSKRGAVESHVAQAGSGDISMVSRLLPMLAPAVVGLLGKIAADDGIDADAMTGQLGAFSTAGPLGDIFTDTTEEDTQGFVQGIASLRDAGGLSALIPAAAPSAALATAAAPTSATVQHLAGPAEGDPKRNGLGWLPAILLPLLALIAGLVLWQCTSPANDTEVAAHSDDGGEDETIGADEGESPDEAEPETPAAEPPAVVTIGERIFGTANLSTVVQLAGEFELLATLADPDAGPFTVFAPTNEAFESANDVGAQLDRDQTRTVVTYHVVPGVYSGADLAAGATLETLAGETLTIGEGVILPGDASIVLGDIEASNGLVHIVDGVLLPDSILAILAAEPEPEPASDPVTIASLALDNPDLSTLVDLAAQFGLIDALSDPQAGPLTVFAPTNDAFEAAGATLDRLDDDQTNTTLAFHVVQGELTSADLVPGATFETVAGEQLVVGDDGTITGGIRIVTADLQADNGIVHIVENVLVPPSISRSLATADVNALFELEPIQFATASADILPASVATLDQAIVTLTSLPAGSVFEVQGHTDSDGSAENNQLLSEQRAASVVAYLTAGGVDPDMLVPVGYGETQLKVDPEATPADFAANRRIEFLDITG